MSEKEEPSPASTCPTCGSEIPTNAPSGICPKCALAEAAAPTGDGTLPMTGTKFEPPPLEKIAEAFPQLEVVELIGHGGMGAVYLARQPNLDRRVALKILSPVLANSPSFTERFGREGRLLARLNHPNIVGVHDFGESGGFFFLIMEYVDGVNLRQAMRAGRFTPEQALGIVPEICEALQFAHDEGVLHRDIKPENILLDEKGRVKIADFGIAKLVDETAPDAFSLTGTAMPGTPQYMAPEQIEHPGDVDHRADIFSLGVVFYEMLTGELPMGRFPAPSEKTAVDSQIDEIVFRSLEKERGRRQQSAGEVKTEVEGISLEALSKIRHPGYGIPEQSAPVPQDSGGKHAAKIVIASLAVLAVFSIIANIAIKADLIREAEWRMSQQIGATEVEAKKVQLEQDIERFETELADNPSNSRRDEILNEIDVRRERIGIEERRLQGKYRQSSKIHAAHNWNGFLIGTAIVLLTLAISIPGTTMGWKSLNRIRVLGAGEGRRAALFAALFWPVATMTFAVFFLTAGPMSRGPAWVSELGVSLALVLSTALGWLAIKRTRRWLKTPPTESERAHALAKVPGKEVNPWWSRILILLACVFLLPLFAYGAALLGFNPGFLELLIAGLLVMIVAIAINHLAKRQRSATGNGSRVFPVEAGNPWPKRIFWLLFCIFAVPVMLILFGLIVPYLTLRQPADASSETVVPIDYGAESGSN